MHLLPRNAPTEMIEISPGGHFSDRARLYFTGSLKLLKPLNYDWVMAIMNIYYGTTPSVYILSITVSRADEGGTTTCLNSCLLSLE